MLVQISELPATARVWIYQANKAFLAEDSPAIEQHLLQFVTSWTSHSRDLKASSVLLHDRFVILVVDEASAGASGCSIDNSVAFMQQLGTQYERDLFDRWQFSYEDENGAVQTVSKDQFKAKYQAGEITDETLVFDPLVNTLSSLKESFKKPLQQSWHKRFV